MASKAWMQPKFVESEKLLAWKHNAHAVTSDQLLVFENSRHPITSKSCARDVTVAQSHHSPQRITHYCHTDSKAPGRVLKAEDGCTCPVNTNVVVDLNLDNHSVWWGAVAQVWSQLCCFDLYRGRQMASLKFDKTFNDIQLMIEICDRLRLLSFLHIVKYWFVIAPHTIPTHGRQRILHIFWSERSKWQPQTIISLSWAGCYQIYIQLNGSRWWISGCG